jgi:hypothetical protein
MSYAIDRRRLGIQLDQGRRHGMILAVFSFFGKKMSMDSEITRARQPVSNSGERGPAVSCF